MGMCGGIMVMQLHQKNAAAACYSTVIACEKQSTRDQGRNCFAAAELDLLTSKNALPV